jgi:tetratricopeptide (TPR) repeat protein
MKTTVLRCAPILLAVLLGAPAAAAQEGDAVEQARLLFEEGLAAARAQEFDRALELFGRSYALNPNPTVTYNMGLCYQKTGDAPAAVQAFTDYLEESGDGLAEDRRTRTQERIDELAPQVGAIRVSVSEPGAQVTLDGRPAGSSPLDDVLYVVPGLHGVEARWGDGEPASQQVVVVPAGIAMPTTVSLARPEEFLDDLPPPPPPDDDEASPVPEWAFWTMVGATGAFGLTAVLTLVFGDATYDDYVAGGRVDGSLRDKGQALDNSGYAFLALAGAALVAGTVLFFYTDFGGGEEQPAEDGAAVALLPGSLVVRW